MTDARGAVVRIAAVGDLHCGRADQGTLKPILAPIAAEADMLLLCGDLVDRGLPEEARVLARELAATAGVPTVAVLGNHDFEAGKEAEVIAILADAGVRVLDGDACEIKGIGIAGVKGFGGGFGTRMLGAWGEPAIKAFVREAIDEALKLETALSQLHVDQRVVLLHYSPIRATVIGEADEIFPFVGSSRLEEPINRYAVAAVFHGHAHAGSPEGQTSAGVPVYNVSVPVLQRAFADRPPFRVVEVPVAVAQGDGRVPAAGPVGGPVAGEAI